MQSRKTPIPKSREQSFNLANGMTGQLFFICSIRVSAASREVLSVGKTLGLKQKVGVNDLIFLENTNADSYFVPLFLFKHRFLVIVKCI